MNKFLKVLGILFVLGFTHFLFWDASSGGAAWAAPKVPSSVPPAGDSGVITFDGDHDPCNGEEVTIIVSADRRTMTVSCKLEYSHAFDVPPDYFFLWKKKD